MPGFVLLLLSSSCLFHSFIASLISLSYSSCSLLSWIVWLFVWVIYSPLERNQRLQSKDARIKGMREVSSRYSREINAAICNTCRGRTLKREEEGRRQRKWNPTTNQTAHIIIPSLILVSLYSLSSSSNDSDALFTRVRYTYGNYTAWRNKRRMTWREKQMKRPSI